MSISKRRANWIAEMKQGKRFELPHYYICRACEKSEDSCNCKTSKPWHHYYYALYPGTKRMIRFVFCSGITAHDISNEDMLWAVDQADKKGWKTVYLVTDLSYGDSVCMLNASENRTAYSSGYSGIHLCMIDSY